LSKALLLAGYLSAGNLGDDAVMLGLVHGLRNYGFDFAALSGAPEETFRLYAIRAFPRRDNKYIKQAIDECDALVFPGGSIFQDATSVGSVFYYEDLVATAKKAGKKVLLLGQGVGPLNNFLSKRKALNAFNAADVVTVRDPGALQALKDIGFRRPVRVTADSAFLLPPPASAAAESDGFNVGNMKTVGVAPRAVKEKGRDIGGLFGEFCRLLYQSGSMPVLITMDRNEDTQLIDEISKKQGGKVPDLRRLNTPMQVQERISRMQSVVAMRLHAGILATSVNVPAMMVSYDPKVASYSRLMELGNALSLEGITATRMLDAFVSFNKDHSRNQKIVERKREELQKAAEGNVQAVLDLMKT
jgi:polysaccharide pyruvyl transferase CsaB